MHQATYRAHRITYLHLVSGDHNWLIRKRKMCADEGYLLACFQGLSWLPVSRANFYSILFQIHYAFLTSEEKPTVCLCIHSTLWASRRHRRFWLGLSMTGLQKHYLTKTPTLYSNVIFLLLESRDPTLDPAYPVE